MLAFWLSLVALCACADAQNCVFAPNCPSFVVWSPGYVCDDGLFVTIKKRAVDGRQVKTVCCSEMTSCSPQQFWCSTQPGGANYSPHNGYSAAALASSCLSGCVTQWKKFTGNGAPLIDGVFAGFFDATTELFVGRVRVFDSFQPGRIIANTAGIFFTYHGVERFSDESVEYLARSPGHTYDWTPSENGSFVNGAVTVNVPRSGSQYVGRVHLTEDRCRVGAVVRAMGGIFYADSDGFEKFASNYEVLTCKLPPASATPIACPIYWRGYSSPSTQSSSSGPHLVIVNAQNGILIGDDDHSYSWANFTSLTDEATPATLVIPGGIKHNIGRIIVDGQAIIGTADVNTGTMLYTDYSGRVRSVVCYEILVCNFNSSTVTTTTGVDATTKTPFTVTFANTTVSTVDEISTSSVSHQETSSTTSSNVDSGSTESTTSRDSSADSTTSSSTDQSSDSTTSTSIDQSSTTSRDDTSQSTTSSFDQNSTASTTTKEDGKSESTTSTIENQNTETTTPKGDGSDITTSSSFDQNSSVSTTTKGDESSDATTSISQSPDTTSPKDSSDSTTSSHLDQDSTTSTSEFHENSDSTTFSNSNQNTDSTTSTLIDNTSTMSTTKVDENSGITTSTNENQSTGSTAQSDHSTESTTSLITDNGSTESTTKEAQSTDTISSTNSNQYTDSSTASFTDNTSTISTTNEDDDSETPTSTNSNQNTGSTTKSNISTESTTSSITGNGSTESTISGAQSSDTTISSHVDQSSTIPTTKIDENPDVTATTISSQSTDFTTPREHTIDSTTSLNVDHSSSGSTTSSNFDQSSTESTISSNEISSTTTFSSVDQNTDSSSSTVTGNGSTETMTKPDEISSTTTSSHFHQNSTESTTKIDETSTIFTTTKVDENSGTTSSSVNHNTDSTTSREPITESSSSTVTDNSSTESTTKIDESTHSTTSSNVDESSTESTTPGDQNSGSTTSLSVDQNSSESTTPWDGSSHSTIPISQSTETTTSVSSTMSSNDSSTNTDSTLSSEMPTLPFNTTTFPWNNDNSTVSTVTESTTMSTTNSPVSHQCSVVWKDYTSGEDLPHQAVTAGLTSVTGAYVGQSSVYGNLLPGRISFNSTQSTYCFYFGVEHCISAFQYLENNDEFTYEWTSSHNGETVMNAIEVQKFYIGRITVNGTLFLGTVVKGYGMVYAEDQLEKWHYSNHSYQVLTCTASPPPPIYECSQQWKKYNGDDEPQFDGISVEDGTNATFVGRGLFLNDFAIGKVQIPPLQPGLLYHNFGNLIVDPTSAEYLKFNPQFTYAWVESSFGLPVEYALSVRRSSAFWPMYIGRVQINSSFVLMGRILPSRGMSCLDADGNEQVIHHYQVLTCTSPTPVCNSACVKSLGNFE